MTSEEIAARAREMQMMMIAAPADAHPGILWQRVLAVCGQAKHPELSAIDFELCSRLVSDQVEEIVSTQPLPDDLAFVYFGLYERLEHGAPVDSARVGFYFAGGIDRNCEEALENGDLSYFPAKRRLRLDTLDRIRNMGRKTPEQREVFGYLVLLGAATVLAKGAIARLGAPVPTFVGFDSGDYFQIGR